MRRKLLLPMSMAHITSARASTGSDATMKNSKRSRTIFQPVQEPTTVAGLVPAIPSPWQGPCHPRHGSGSQHRVFRIPLFVDSVQLRRLDLAADACVAAGNGVADRAVLVRPGHVVRMGLLSVHGLALASPRAAGSSRSTVVHPADDP